MRAMLPIVAVTVMLAVPGCNWDFVDAEFTRITFANRLNRPIEIVNERGQAFQMVLRDGSKSVVITPGAVGQMTMELRVQNACQGPTWSDPCYQRTVTVVWAREIVPGQEEPLSTPCTLSLEEGRLVAFQIQKSFFGAQMVCDEVVGGVWW